MSPWVTQAWSIVGYNTMIIVAIYINSGFWLLHNVFILAHIYTCSMVTCNQKGVCVWIKYQATFFLKKVFSLSSQQKSFVILYSTWAAKEGPKRDSYNISDNPQFRLEIRANQPAAVWILLTRHITDKVRTSVSLCLFVIVNGTLLDYVRSWFLFYLTEKKLPEPKKKTSWICLSIHIWKPGSWLWHC